LFFILLSLNKVFSQDDKPIIYDDFSKKSLTGWSASGNIDFKYSHSEDNTVNGYCVVFTKESVKANISIGIISKSSPVLFGLGNYINILMKGVSNDVNVKLNLLYDIDDNGYYNDDKDIILQSKSISLNFDDWKEIKLKLSEDNFSIISKFNDDFSVVEEEAIGIQLVYETGKNFKEAKFETGIGIISEIYSKDYLTNKENSKESSIKTTNYFDARNYPNPFNPRTTISYTLPSSSHVKITIYDSSAKEIEVLVDESQSQGTHTVEFNGDSLPSGIYFYRIKTSDKTEVKKMILAK
jgi:hypothetical protein